VGPVGVGRASRHHQARQVKSLGSRRVYESNEADPGELTVSRAKEIGISSFGINEVVGI